MSRSPLDESPETRDQEERYFDGWAALNESLRRGEPWSGGERNAAFVSSGGRSLDFVDAGPVLGLDFPDDGRSAARMDVDFDGDDDLIVSNRTAPRLRILANRLADGAEHLAVRLRGTTVNRDAIGAVVFATTAGEGGEREVQRRTRGAGTGYLAQSSAWLRFGFGRRGSGDRPSRARRVQLKVRWPGVDALEDFGEVRTGRRYLLVQGTGAVSEAAAPEQLTLSPGPLVAPERDPDDRRRLVLPSPTSIPGLDVRGRSGRSGRIFGLTPNGPKGTGRDTVIAVWDSTDPTAVEGLGDLAALKAAAAGTNTMLVSVDLGARAPEPEAAGASTPAPDPLDFSATRLAAAGWAGDVLAPLGETALILPEIVSWRLDRTEPPSLPWFLTLEPDGRLAVVRTGPWREGDLAADLDIFARPLAQRPAWSTPYPGRWADPPGEADLGRLRSRLARRGASTAARELELGRIKTATLGSAEVKIRLGRAALERGDLQGALARFDAAIGVEPDNALARRGRAYVLHRLAQYSEALEEWTRALDLDPTDAETRGNRALAAVEAGDLEVARADLAALTGSEGAAAPMVRVLKQAVEEASREVPGGASGGDGGGDR